MEETRESLGGGGEYTANTWPSSPRANERAIDLGGCGHEEKMLGEEIC